MKKTLLSASLLVLLSMGAQGLTFKRSADIDVKDQGFKIQVQMWGFGNGMITQPVYFEMTPQEQTKSVPILDLLKQWQKDLPNAKNMSLHISIQWGKSSIICNDVWGTVFKKTSAQELSAINNQQFVVSKGTFGPNCNSIGRK